jgi:hypothetical protein
MLRRKIGGENFKRRLPKNIYGSLFRFFRLRLPHWNTHSDEGDKRDEELQPRVSAF